MRVIYKYTIPADGMQAQRGDVRLVGYQGDSSELPTIWIEHTIGGGGLDEYHFIGTGMQFDQHPADEFVGSAQCGRFVWHVFRRRVS